MNRPKGYCQICRCLLDNPADPVRSRDCGGDCLQCMTEYDDPDCRRALDELEGRAPE